MRRWIVPALAAVLLLAACGGAGRPLSRYYDPQGLFSVELPTKHQIQVVGSAPADEATGFPEVLGGVFSSEQPSPQAPTGFGAQASQPDLTTYFVVALGTGSRQELEDFLTTMRVQQGGDLKVDRPASIGGRAGGLVVSNFGTAGGGGVLVAGVLQQGNVGYLIGATFPGDDWETESGDFTRILDSFRANGPPGISTLPLTGA